MTIVELPAALLLGGWLLAQVILGAVGLERDLGAGAGPHLAHVAPFAFGLLVIWPFAKRLRKPEPPRLPVY